MRNLLSKIPAGMQAKVTDAYGKIVNTDDVTTPPGPVAIIAARITVIPARYPPPPPRR